MSMINEIFWWTGAILFFCGGLTTLVSIIRWMSFIIIKNSRWWKNLQIAQKEHRKLKADMAIMKNSPEYKTPKDFGKIIKTEGQD